MSISRQIFNAAERSVDELRNIVEGQKLSLRITNGAGQTLAHIAAKNDKLDVLKYVLEKDPSLLHKRDGYNCTLLHIASVKGSFSVVKYLVEEHRVDICHLGGRYQDRTAVHGVVEFNHLKILKYFVEERNVDYDIPNEGQSQPPIFLAIKRRNWDVIRYLVEEKRANVKLLNVNDENILFVVVRENALDIMKYLLDEMKFYFNVDCRSYYGETLVHIAAILDRMEILRYLVEEKNADVNVRKRSDKRTPLHYAASRDNFEVCKFLVEHGANANTVDTLGQIPADKAKTERLMEYLESVATKQRSVRSVSSPYAPLEPVPAVSPFQDTQQRSIESPSSSVGVLLLATLVKKMARSETEMNDTISFASPSSVLRSRMSSIAIDVVDAGTDFLES